MTNNTIAKNQIKDRCGQPIVTSMFSLSPGYKKLYLEAWDMVAPKYDPKYTPKIEMIYGTR